MSEPPREPPSSEPAADEATPAGAAPGDASAAEALPAASAALPAEAAAEAAPSASPARYRPWVTYALTAANIGIWILTVALGAPAFDPSAQWLFDHGGNRGAVTLDGEQWRLFTSMFLHAGLLHVGMNMLGLITGGRLVERLFGRLGFTVIYLVGGLAGSLASALRPTGGVVSIGASGAIFGVLAAVCAYYVLHRERLDQSTAKETKWLLICIGYNVIFGLRQSGIDMYAHTGGFVGGFLCGLALEIGRGGGSRQRAFAVGAIGLAVVLGAAFAVPAPVDAVMAFAAVEDKVLTRWSELVDQAQADAVGDDQLADVIEKEILPPWRAGREAFDQSGAGGPKRDVLLDYMRLRQEGWEMMIQGLRANDGDAVKRGQERFEEADAVGKKLIE